MSLFCAWAKSWNKIPTVINSNLGQDFMRREEYFMDINLKEVKNEFTKLYTNV